MSKPKLIIMVGNIASGKTSWIKNYLKCKEAEIDSMHDKYVVLSKDDLRKMFGAGEYLWEEQIIEPIVHECLISILHHSMQRNVNIIIDETNMDRETRRDYMCLTKHRNTYLGYDYETIAVVMPKISMDHAIERRCGLNESAWGFSKEVWKKVYIRKQGKFQIPTEEEGFDEILEIK